MNQEGAVRAARQRLDKVCRDRPELQKLGRITGDLLAAWTAPVPMPVARSVPPVVPACWERGLPAWRESPPLLDRDLLRQRWIEVCRILVTGTAPGEAQRLSATVSTESLDPAHHIAEILAHGRGSFQGWLCQEKFDEGLGFTVLRLTSLPLLAALAQSFAESLRSLRWNHRVCPICGSDPLLAELRGLEQLRWLRCGWCAAQWQVERIRCPFCQQRDHRRLHDVYLQDQETGYRLSKCDSCGEALPTLPTLEAITPPGLLVAELESLHLWFVSA